MKMNIKKESIVVTLLKRELRNEKIEKIIFFSLFFIFIFSLSVLMIFFTTKLYMTGFAPYISSEAGTITHVDLVDKFPVYHWHGLYGLALRVPGFSDFLYQDIDPMFITRQDLFFDCIQSDSTGGRDIFTTNDTLINWGGLVPANLTYLNEVVGCSGLTECPNNTFTGTSSFYIGSTEIQNVPTTHTLKTGGELQIFDIGVMFDGNNFVYATHVNSTVQKGYSQFVTVNYQMLIPQPENTTQRFYFYTDPNDECPAGGGVGENIEVNVSGYVKDPDGNVLENASVNVAGYQSLSDANGSYNITFIVIPGSYNMVATKTGYQPGIEVLNVSFNYTEFFRNITLNPVTDEDVTIEPMIYGIVSDENGDPIENATVLLGDASDLSNASGYYVIFPTINPAPHPIISIKQDYNNYYALLNFTNSTTVVNHNITMITATINYTYVTGPYTTGPYSQGPFATGPYTTQTIEQIIIEEQKKGEDYWISSKEIVKEVRQNTFIEEVIGIYNFLSTSMNIAFTLSPELEDFVKIDKSSATIANGGSTELVVTIYGTKPLGEYNGTLTLSGDIEKQIPVSIKIVERRFVVEALLMEIDLFRNVVMTGDNLKYKLNLQNLLRDQGYKVDLRVSVREPNSSIEYAVDSFETEIMNSLTVLREIEIPKNVSEGDYVLHVDARYLNQYSSATSPFRVSKPIYLYAVFGIPLWIIFMIISFFSFLFLNFFIYKVYKDRKKRYKIEVEYSTLPKPGEKVVRLGHIAETKNDAYYELEKMKTHCIVAGATGMGKSISAQVIIEEALMNNIAVIVFDPTAQWSGMLRKCDDKKMMSYYPKFGLKEGDARAFKGNVRQVLDARQIIDVRKHMNPGQIQIFSLNKLDPKDIDFFVANVIRQIFRSDPKESPTLKLIIVFDEVHRLLSKFGGSGEGFLQVERACREFRKWGLGVMLISQVLNDFVGEIKANINTEVQTRTLEENDLARIKTKYGDEFLKSLVRAEVGVAMFQNAEYNRGRPYFINFRPILHNTRRLPDEELAKYNKYNDIVDDLEFQIEQLEKLKVDVFDLKMELKLVKDKIMTGSFSVVEIYLEGLKPRLEKQWQKLGKKPPKRQLQLVSEADVKKSIEEAKKERQKIVTKEKNAANAAKAKAATPKKVDLQSKDLKPFTFDNGMMISNLKEMKEVLLTIDDGIFKTHVNEKKNDISKWISENVSPAQGNKLKNVLDKKALSKAISMIK